MFLDLIRQRRSIRKFKDQPVEKDKLELILEAGLRSPSSMGRNPWEFVVITRREVLTALSSAKPHGASFLKNAPLGIAVTADPEKCDVWIEDTSIASTYIQLAAHSLGLGSCWIQFRERFYKEGFPAEKRVAELLNIPENYQVLSIIAIGYPDESKKGHEKSSLLYDKIHFGTFGS